MPQNDPLDGAREQCAVESTDSVIIAKCCVWLGCNGECEHWWSRSIVCTSHSLRDCTEHVPVQGCWAGYAGVAQ